METDSRVGRGVGFLLEIRPSVTMPIVHIGSVAVKRKVVVVPPKSLWREQKREAALVGGVVDVVWPLAIRSRVGWHIGI